MTTMTALRRILARVCGLSPAVKPPTWPYAAERQPIAERSPATIAEAMRTELAGIDNERRADLERTR